MIGDIKKLNCFITEFLNQTTNWMVISYCMETRLYADCTWTSWPKMSRCSKYILTPYITVRLYLWVDNYIPQCSVHVCLVWQSLQSPIKYTPNNFTRNWRVFTGCPLLACLPFPVNVGDEAPRNCRIRVNNF